MSNRKCNGDRFEVDNVKYYSCSWDGEVCEIDEDTHVCPLCGKEMKAVDYGDVTDRVKVVTRRYVRITPGNKVELPVIRKGIS